MKIEQLSTHNIQGLDIVLPSDMTIGISGWSGSGKSSFCRAVVNEAIKRLVTILPKSQYMFAFPDLVKTNFGSLKCMNFPCVEYLDNSPASANVRSTVGTHSGLFRDIRSYFARETGLPSEYFSFNTPLSWCVVCKGRGALRGKICSECSGRRYSQVVSQHRVHAGKVTMDIIEANALSLERVLALGKFLGLSPVSERIARNAAELGIGYLELDRTVGTLSGGEFTRLLLAERLGLSEGMLYILDEPGLGLDAVSTAKLLGSLSALGVSNQLWIIDHSRHVIDATQQKIIFGPGSGMAGGQLVAEAATITPNIPIKNAAVGPALVFKGLRCRTIDLASITLPTGSIVAITGESGSGKTTLVRDILIPRLQEKKPGVPDFVYVGQGRNSAVTSLSTIGTFLGLTAVLRSAVGTRRKPCHFCYGTGRSEAGVDCTWCLGTGMDPDFYQSVVWKGIKIGDLLNRPISESLQAFTEGSHERRRLEFLVKLGAGYLSLGRKVRTLSTGEFQRLHLCREFVSEQGSMDRRIFILDEPSRGLSQNYLNEFATALRELVEVAGATVWLIEHNEFLLACSDFVVDFGSRRDRINRLDAVPYDSWSRSRHSAPAMRAGFLHSSIKMDLGIFNIEGVDAERDAYFESARLKFESGLLRTLSPTAQWIYGKPENPQKSSTVAIDFEDSLLYSDETFLFELLDLTGHLLVLSGRAHSELSRFDYMDCELLCSCCKGRGRIDSFDFNLVTADATKGLWQGLLHDEVMTALRDWNFSKIKFLFERIKATTGLDLSKPATAMSQEEQKVLWHGLWDRSYHWPKKDSFYTWRGLGNLIQKYMPSSSSGLKTAIKESKYSLTCPACSGTLLAHSQPLMVRGHDIRDILRMTLAEAAAKFPEVELLSSVGKVAPVGARLNDLLSTWPKDRLVKLKLFELDRKGFFGYRFVFRNLLPWRSAVESSLISLSCSNRVELCDSTANAKTREELLGQQPNVKGTSLVWEVIGFKEVGRELARLKKTHKCTYCSGSGRFEIESPEGYLDKAVVTCDACHSNGFDLSALSQMVCGASASTWLNGVISDLPGEIRPIQLENLADIKLAAKLQKIPKYQLAALINWKHQSSRKQIHISP